MAVIGKLPITSRITKPTERSTRMELVIIFDSKDRSIFLFHINVNVLNSLYDTTDNMSLIRDGRKRKVPCTMNSLSRSSYPCATNCTFAFSSGVPYLFRVNMKCLPIVVDLDDNALFLRIVQLFLLIGPSTSTLLASN